MWRHGVYVFCTRHRYRYLCRWKQTEPNFMMSWLRVRTNVRSRQIFRWLFFFRHILRLSIAIWWLWGAGVCQNGSFEMWFVCRDRLIIIRRKINIYIEGLKLYVRIVLRHWRGQVFCIAMKSEYDLWIVFVSVFYSTYAYEWWCSDVRI